MRISNRLQWGIAIFIVAALVISKTFFLDFFTVAQDGMYPAISKDSRVWVNKFAYSKVSDVQRGDIAVYDYVEDGQTYKYIWRVIGLPGEHIQAKDADLIINGITVPHLPLRTDGDRQILLEKLPNFQFEICYESTRGQLPPEADLTLADDEFFLMGDNRYSASDNRYKGPVKFSSIIGKKF